MTVLYPEAVQSQGNVSVLVVQAIADTTAPKLATELKAASSVNVSCFMYSGGMGTSTTNKGQSPRRLCTKDQFDTFGNTTYDVTDLQYLYSPQGDSSDAANQAKGALTEGTEVYLVIRSGLDAQETAFAASQVVDIWHVRLGPQNRTMTGDGEFDEFSITQTVAVLSPPSYDAVIAA